MGEEAKASTSLMPSSSAALPAVSTGPRVESPLGIPEILRLQRLREAEQTFHGAYPMTIHLRDFSAYLFSWIAIVMWSVPHPSIVAAFTGSFIFYLYGVRRDRVSSRGIPVVARVQRFQEKFFRVTELHWCYLLDGEMVRGREIVPRKDVASLSPDSTTVVILVDPKNGKYSRLMRPKQEAKK